MTKRQASASTHGLEEQPHGQDADDRRGRGDRRRNASGLFEVRARRDGVGGDRRQGQDGRRFGILAFWRRAKP